jgi:CheY-like chemotaxis protein
LKRVLVVDDSKTVLKQIEIEFTMCKDIELIMVETYKDAMKKIREYQGNFNVALLDLNLPDAPNGEVVSLANAHNIPSVILTGSLSVDTKANIQKKDILAYVLKNSPNSIRLAVKFAQRALKNYDTNILIVDDSKLYRGILSKLVQEMNINVFQVEDAKEALEFLNTTKEKISLVLTDYEMPGMNGLNLTMKLRENFDKDQLGIIALSNINDASIVSDFFKIWCK